MDKHNAIMLLRFGFIGVMVVQAISFLLPASADLWLSILGGFCIGLMFAPNIVAIVEGIKEIIRLIKLKRKL